MKKYIATKEVSATPAWRVNGVVYPKDSEVPESMNREDGYKVVYEDGHESWLPKDVFEKTYEISETVLDRLRVEEGGLWDKVTKCLCFMESKDFRKIVTDEYQATLLKMQFDSMCEYLDIVRLRIDELANKENAKLKEDVWWSFGQAIQALNVGACVRRKGWSDKRMFVVKQVPTHIAEEIIPTMQSLPQSAKDIIMGRNNKHIDYTNQMLIIDCDGRADSWTPSFSDLFANDWEIVLE